MQTQSRKTGSQPQWRTPEPQWRTRRGQRLQSLAQPVERCVLSRAGSGHRPHDVSFLCVHPEHARLRCYGFVGKNKSHISLVVVHGKNEALERALVGAVKGQTLANKCINCIFDGGYVVTHKSFVQSLRVYEFEVFEEEGDRFGVAEIQLLPPQAAVAVGLVRARPQAYGLPTKLLHRMATSIDQCSIRFLSGVFPKHMGGEDFLRMCWEQGAPCPPFRQPFRGNNGSLYAWPHYCVVFGPTQDANVNNKYARWVWK